jgi:Tfp pilus assembly protein PilV
MKYTQPLKNQAGIGLIEVLITTVVIAFGLLSMASLQSDLISHSGENKTHAECQSLANTKIEQLRDTVAKTGVSSYAALASSTTDESITGVTQTFTRSWVITSQTDPDCKQVNVLVTWGSGGANNQCLVQSLIAYDSLGNSSLIASGVGNARIN